MNSRASQRRAVGDPHRRERAPRPGGAGGRDPDDRRKRARRRLVPRSRRADLGGERPRHRDRHGQVRTHRAQDRSDARLDRRAGVTFVHPAEASHGDLGMVQSGDIVLAISWSGETAELAAIVTFAKRYAIPLIAMTAHSDSALGREADVCLTMPSVAEACPNGLAPTTSTTMQLVLGDALAIALLEGRGFTALDFQALHPGGKLGARLAHVRDVMHTGERVPRIAASARMAEAIVEMTSKGFGCVAVIEDRDRLVGILTDGDLRRHLKPGFSLDTQVAGVMTRRPRTIAPDALVAEALESDQPQDLGASGCGARPGGRDRAFPRSDAHRRVLREPASGSGSKARARRRE